jgi:hypothetical protein
MCTCELDAFILNSIGRCVLNARSPELALCSIVPATDRCSVLVELLH